MMIFFIYQLFSPGKRAGEFSRSAQADDLTLAELSRGPFLSAPLCGMKHLIF